MSPIPAFALFAGFVVTMHPAWSNDRDACSANAGTLLVGTVSAGPRFARGHEKRGIELSHTHVKLRGDDGQLYDIAIDDVFADGYDQADGRVPAPLSRIQTGDRLELCGKPYSSGSGMDWVHSNCGDIPTVSNPNGWVKIIGANGTPGPNLESNQEYCRLWQK